jgi:hypothetical protein
VKIVKSSYYVRKLENVKSDIKSTWKALNEVINKRPKTNFSSSFKSSIDNTEIPDPVEIANKLSSATIQFLVLVQTLLRKFTHLPNSIDNFFHVTSVEIGAFLTVKAPQPPR